MQANTSVPALKREFGGFAVEVPATFIAGDTFTADTAAWVNSQIATVIGNAAGGFFRREKEAFLKEGGKEKDYKPSTDMQSKVSEIYAEYSLSGNRGAGTGKSARDPVAALVDFLAKEAVKAKLRAKSLNIKDYMQTMVPVEGGAVGEEQSAFSRLVAQYKDAHPELEDQAKAQLAQDEAAASDDDGLDFDLGKAA